MHFVRQSAMIHEASNRPQEIYLWNSFHKLMVQPKIWMFLWRVAQNVLPDMNSLAIGF